MKQTINKEEVRNIRDLGYTIRNANKKGSIFVYANSTNILTSNIIKIIENLGYTLISVSTDINHNVRGLFKKNVIVRLV